MIAYLDSSAILKQYLLDEPGLADVHSIATDSESVATSRLSYVEVRAGLAAASRSGRLDRIRHDRVVTAFLDDWAGFDVVEFSSEVSAHAGAIADRYGLRAGDSIQLASMLELDPRHEVIVVAWDAQLRAAAASAGLAVFSPGH